MSLSKVLYKQVWDALNKKQFHLNYFPCFDASSGSLLGAEALLRWRHPEKGLIMPEHFLPQIENYDVMTNIGDWVLSTASEQVNAWRKAHNSSMYISVNVSEKQLMDPYFDIRVMQILYKTGLEPDALCIEFTENINLSHISDLHIKLHELRKMGIRFALDDFGTNLASLEHLRDYPIDIVKIDMGFVKDIEFNPKSYAICEAIISLCKKLGITVISEGVENNQQMQILIEMGVDSIHGFYLAKPLNADRFEQMIRSDQLNLDF